MSDKKRKEFHIPENNLEKFVELAERMGTSANHLVNQYIAVSIGVDTGAAISALKEIGKEK